ncbi:hypothetical protein KFE25_009110 [Diacronema lutheri]|uniref:Protein root UVB sensitive/RUS domain-containing protein n=3 Tax=Diacronema lutheri TaxID=2081491 RepID=A0A8J5Y4C3_DIALT|nr:hypothetical protein KFE25_009110 [Diacronema lutheri]
MSLGAEIADPRVGTARELLVLGVLPGEHADRIEWDGDARRWRRARGGAAADSQLGMAWHFVSRPLARLLLMGTDAVTLDYYRFTKWRMAQRLFSAVKDVFATQALLGALGVRADGARGGVAAAGAWIGKESFGRLSKIVWSGKMRKLMDADAKRVRFRTAVLYPLGQLLELSCSRWPHLFLLLGTAGIFCKQISQMTASATRSAFYRSFSADGAAGAIGEMTATGEAQVSVASAVGIAIGIFASDRLLGGRAALFPPVFALLCALDVCATYMEVRSVVCARLNHERTQLVLSGWLRERRAPSPAQVAARERVLRGSGAAHAFAAPAQLRLGPAELAPLLSPWEGHVFAIVPAWALGARARRGMHARIVLSAWARCSQEGILCAWLAHCHACELLADVRQGDLVGAQLALSTARERADADFPALRSALVDAGWNLASFAFLPIGADDRAAWDLTAGRQSSLGRHGTGDGAQEARPSVAEVLHAPPSAPGGGTDAELEQHAAPFNRPDVQFPPAHFIL